MKDLPYESSIKRYMFITSLPLIISTLLITLLCIYTKIEGYGYVMVLILSSAPINYLITILYAYDGYKFYQECGLRTRYEFSIKEEKAVHIPVAITVICFFSGVMTKEDLFLIFSLISAIYFIDLRMRQRRKPVLLRESFNKD